MKLLSRRVYFKYFLRVLSGLLEDYCWARVLQGLRVKGLGVEGCCGVEGLGLRVEGL